MCPTSLMRFLKTLYAESFEFNLKNSQTCIFFTKLKLVKLVLAVSIWILNNAIILHF